MRLQKNESKIEILSVDLLKNESDFRDQFLAVSSKLGTGLGWHYLLDLSWAASQLVPLTQRVILDAGAGVGIMQWWLAALGVNVISVDRGSRYTLPPQFRELYRLKGWRKIDLAPLVGFYDFLPSKSPQKWHLYPRKLSDAIKKAWQASGFGKPKGIVYIYNQDLADLIDVSSNSIDAIVSISALEHNTPDGLRNVYAELMRVLKPGGKLIATLGAAKDQDWFHEPSKGWCYTETSLREIFDMPVDCPSNYDRYDEFFDALCNCAELRDNLADFYFKSGDNGMPWGIWDPKYQSVGIVKVKSQ
jgi:SAM-dependent methyltransferase